MVNFFSRTPSPLSLSSPSKPPKRGRLRHGAPPFFEGWAVLRVPPVRKPQLRYCTLSGPHLRYSATPGHPILAGCVVVYSATVTSEEFPSLRICIRLGPSKMYISAESRQEHLHFFAQLLDASKRSLTAVYRFRYDLRDAGFGRCSAAVDMQTSESVCVKVTSKHKYSPFQVGHARKEAVLLLCMPDHLNIVPIVDVYESARTLYLVTEFAEAYTLAELVQYRGMLCEADVATVISSLLQALLHMQKCSVIHRLICPQNVLLVPKYDNSVGVAKLHNFEYGVSAIDIDEWSHIVDNVGEDNSPLLLSQLAYVGPEVAAGELGGFEQDVWSVGIVMHYLLVGCTPFDEHLHSIEDLTGTIASTRGKPTFEGKLWGGVTSGAKHLCASLLHANAGERINASDALVHPWLKL